MYFWGRDYKIVLFNTIPPTILSPPSLAFWQFLKPARSYLIETSVISVLYAWISLLSTLHVAESFFSFKSQLKYYHFSENFSASTVQTTRPHHCSQWQKSVSFNLVIASWSHFVDFLNYLSPLLNGTCNEGQEKSVIPAVTGFHTRHVNCNISLVDKWKWVQESEQENRLNKQRWGNAMLKVCTLS